MILLEEIRSYKLFLEENLKEACHLFAVVNKIGRIDHQTYKNTQYSDLDLAHKPHNKTFLVFEIFIYKFEQQ